MMPWHGVLLGVVPARESGHQAKTAAPDLSDGETRVVGTHGRETWALGKKFIRFRAAAPLQESADFSLPSHF